MKALITNNSLRRLLVALCVCFPAMTVGQGNPEAATAKKLKIGVIAPLSSAMASYGTAIKNGALLAQQSEERGRNVEFLFEDDAFQARNTIVAAQKLIGEAKVDGLIVFGSGPALAAAPLAEQLHVPMVAFATDRAVVRDRKYVMAHFASPITETTVVLKEVAQRGYKSVAIVTTYQEAMLNLRDEFVARKAVKVVADEEAMPHDLDLRAVVSKVVAAKPDAVYLLLMPPQIGVFARQLRERGFTGPLFGAHALEDPHEVEVSQGALTGTWFVSINSVQDPTFASRYQEAFGSPPANVASNGYDVAKMIMEYPGSPSLIYYLRNLKDFHGVMGTYGARRDGTFDVPVMLKKITAAGFEPLS